MGLPAMHATKIELAADRREQHDRSAAEAMPEHLAALSQKNDRDRAMLERQMQKAEPKLSTVEGIVTRTHKRMRHLANYQDIAREQAASQTTLDALAACVAAHNALMAEAWALAEAPGKPPTVGAPMPANRA